MIYINTKGNKKIIDRTIFLANNFSKSEVRCEVAKRIDLITNHTKTFPKIILVHCESVKLQTAKSVKVFCHFDHLRNQPSFHLVLSLILIC